LRGIWDEWLKYFPLLVGEVHALFLLPEGCKTEPLYPHFHIYEIASRQYGTHAGDVRDELSDPETRHLLTFNPPSLRHTPIMTAMRRSFTSQSPAWMAASVRCLSHNLLQDLGYLAKSLSSWSAPAIGVNTHFSGKK
jgi:hypothetical protein